MQSDNYLKHFGIKGQKWGVRRYQNKDGTLTNAGKKRYYKEYNEAYEHAKNDDVLRDRVKNAALNQKKLNDAVRKRSEYSEIKNDKSLQEGKKLIDKFKKEMAKSYSETFSKDVDDLYGGDSAIAKAIDELLDYNVLPEKKR